MRIVFVVLLSLAGCCLAQRPGFAGSAPWGYPVIVTTTTSTTSAPAASGNDMGNRFGNDQMTTTQRLPLEANGDRQLIEYLSSLPVEQQPFWFANWRALEADRQQPHTYQVRDNGYIDMPMSGQQGPQLADRSMYLS